MNTTTQKTSFGIGFDQRFLSIAGIWPLLAVMTFLPNLCFAQGTKEDFQRSRNYRASHRNLVFRDVVAPHWLGDTGSRFWYRVETAKECFEYVLVDASEGKRQRAIDQQRLAKELAEATGRQVQATNLGLKALALAENASQCWFRYDGRSWKFVLPAGPLSEENATDRKFAPKELEPQPRIVRSRGGGRRAVIRFENKLARPLTFYWVMPDGNLRRYGTVKAGQTVRIDSYAGHAWVLKDSDGVAVASFVASSSAELAVIDGETARPRPLRNRDSKARSRPPRTTSPDAKWRISFENHNVVLIDNQSDRRIELTDDGNVENAYGGKVWWSPNSKHFVLMKTKPGLERDIQLVESAPQDSVHPRLLTIPYLKPGDRVNHPRPVLFRAASDWMPRMIDDSLFANPYDLRDLAWHPDNQSFSFLYNQRGHQCVRLITVSSAMAEPRITIDESSDTFVCYSSKSFLHRVHDTDELIWMSERSGWNHLYLIDAETGRVKNAITAGRWVVRRVERVDELNRQIYCAVSGIDPGQDPYHLHLVRIDFDGTNLVRLTRGDGNHQWRFSPGEKYLIDTYSRVDLPPVTELRDAGTGELVCNLERAEAAALLETGWQPPERFVAKGRDGQTDIHGILVRPTNFQPGRKYPVLEQIYAGPHSSFVPKEFGLHSSLYSMAELGFIVVKIDGMGTSNRSKAFHDVCWQNLADSGFPDRIAWIRAAAETRPEMDLNRVGIWGGSAGGQSAMRALISHGDFYHAAVADCGCHDNRVDKMWWNEQWMGWPIGPHYKSQSNVTGADRLRGDLMLIWGELDRNVDPSSTMQVIDALIRADKDFEQLIVPGSGHGAAGHPYAKRRQADFFIRKLWNREPRAD